MFCGRIGRQPGWSSLPLELCLPILQHSSAHTPTSSLGPPTDKLGPRQTKPRERETKWRRPVDYSRRGEGHERVGGARVIRLGKDVTVEVVGAVVVMVVAHGAGPRHTKPAGKSIVGGWSCD
jgi:hypothetical protein